jgi:very-short-patch-repair endonuclease
VLDAERRWLEVAAVQAGVVSRGQMLGLGGTSSTITRRLTEGRLRLALPGVYVVAGSPSSDVQRWWIALLATGPEAVLSFESAARIHGVSTVPADGPTVLTVRHSGWQRLPDVVVHQLNDLDPTDVVDHDGLPVTSLPRTIVDLAAIWRRGRLRMAVEDAVAARQTTDADIGRCLRSVARRGKPGVRNLTAVLDDRGPGTSPPASQLERDFFDLVRRSALPEPRRQHPLPRRDGVHGLVDAAWPEVKLIVEVDGRRWHQRLADMRRDRDRDIQAAAAGWLVVRLLHEHIVGAPDETVRELLDVYAARAALLDGAA